MVLFSGLMAVSLSAVFIAVNAASLNNARVQIHDDLNVAERVFLQLVKSRGRQMADGARILSSDFAFKRAMATWDHGTILSALENLGARVGADSMALVSLDYILIADTSRPEAQKEDFQFPELIEKAEEEGDAFSFVPLGGRASQIAVVPLLAPDPMAWLLVSFALDQPLVEELRRLTQAHISLFQVFGDGRAQLAASTLPPAIRGELMEKASKIGWSEKESVVVALGGDDYVSLVTTVFKDESFLLAAVLQRPLEERLAPFYRLRAMLIAISALGLIVTVIGAVVTARRVTKPVLELVRGVRETGNGNYGFRVDAGGEDELGELAGAFNNMALGLEERDKARNLLGKVMSPSVAHELLTREVRMGGEERMMTAFFSDVAGFTAIAEKLDPVELVSLLNEYLSAMADIIYETGGVIDKFIGDAIVAFWGAPLPQERDAELAVAAAVRMQRKLAGMRGQWRERGVDELYMRIGINTGRMVVGAMGSKDRMDYTMMGDAVNLAARLEGANKYYGSGIIVSQFTRERVKGRFLLRELDLVRVQGKKAAVGIYEVMGENGEVGGDLRLFAERFEEALALFRAREFGKAGGLFGELSRMIDGGDKACELYVQRAGGYLADPPPPDWDGAHDLAK